MPKTYTEVYYEDDQKPEGDLTTVTIFFATAFLLFIGFFLVLNLFSSYPAYFHDAVTKFKRFKLIDFYAVLFPLFVFLVPVRIDSRSSVSLSMRAFWFGCLFISLGVGNVKKPYYGTPTEEGILLYLLQIIFEPIFLALQMKAFFPLVTLFLFVGAFGLSAIWSGRASVDPNYRKKWALGWILLIGTGCTHLYFMPKLRGAAFYYHDSMLWSYLGGACFVSWFILIIRRNLIRQKVKLREDNVEEVKNVVLDTNKDFSLGDVLKRMTHESGTHINDAAVKKAILASHQMVFGTTGWGKTFGVLEPQIFHSISKGQSTLIFDPKGDVKLRDFVYGSCVASERKDDFFFFSLTEKSESHRFNPFKGLSKNEIKDIILASTDWSEPHYRKLARTALMQALWELPDNPTISDILERIPRSKDLAGIRADLEAFKISFGELIDHRDAPGLIDLQQSGKVCFFSIDIQALPDEAPQIFRLLLCALNVVSLRAQRQMESERKDTLIVVDECGEFITNEFVEFLNKARSSKMRIILSTQTPHDFKSEQICNRILDLTNVKVIGRVMEGSSREKLSKLVGTHTMLEHTYSESTVNGSSNSGKSTRKVKHLICHMDMIKQLPRGVGIVTVSEPFTVNQVQFTQREKINFGDYSYSQYLKMKNSKKETDMAQVHSVEIERPEVDWEEIERLEIEKAKRRLKELEERSKERNQLINKLGSFGLSELNELVKTYVRDGDRRPIDAFLIERGDVSFDKACSLMDLEGWIEVERKKLNKENESEAPLEAIVPPKTEGKGVDDLFQ